MKKRLLGLMGAALMLLSASAADGYRITGTAEGVEPGDTVYLCEMQGFFSMVPTDTTVVGKDGKFAFTGDFDGATFRYILPFHKGKNISMADFMLENADIDMQIFADPKKRPVINSNGIAAKMYREYEAAANEYDKQIDKPWTIFRDSTSTKEAKAIAKHQIDSLQAIRDGYTKTYLVANIPSALSDYLFAMYENKFSEPEKEIVMKKMDAGHHYYYYKGMMEEKKAQEATAIGKTYTDFAMPNPQGKTVKVSDYVKKNKYTLIDFWASWCGPCRKEMPTVVKAYSTYHKKGFEVVGVSFDNNKGAWTKAIKTLNLPWPHMSDLKGWGCAAASIYNVKGIPANVLVDKNGTIIAKDLRGEDLLNKLAELMK